MNSSPADAAAAVPLGIAAEKNKQWQRELLMEKIRSHSSQHKTFQELSKSMRMSMLEKRYALDAVEKTNLQKCLDSMQHCIKVTSRQGLVERLESLSRQLGLKFMEDTSGLFISTDMFYLEIILDANGSLTDVKVHHECKIEQQSCSELVNCLNRGDFTDFTVQLEGLSSIYQLNAEPKVKTKAFVALQAMETDLYSLYQSQNFSKDAQAVLAESSVGIVLQRRGGHPMRLTYFVSPYDLISLEAKTMIPLTVDLITSKNIGMSVTVNLEASSANKLQILPTVAFNKEGMTDVPVFSPLTPLNSTLLPATFVLRLNKPLPVCQNMLRSLIPTQLEPGVISPGDGGKQQTTSIMKLIIQTASENQVQNSSKGLFVCLPDQTHCYFFTENKQMKASIVSSVPFTEPSQVPKILAVLKKHALFFTLLSSCVRSQSKMGDMESTTILEVNAISFNQISVALEHPYEESMATVEFNLNDMGMATCEIYSLSTNYESLAEKLTLIIQQSLSIPITIRSLLKYWDQERIKCFQRGIGDYGNFNLAQGPIDPGGRGGSDFRDLKGSGKPGGADRGGSSNGNFGAGGNRPFFHATGIANNAAEGFPELASAVGVGGSMGSGLIKPQFKSEVKQEDFCKSPKSNLTLQSEISSNDSSSLGTLSAVAPNSSLQGMSIFPATAMNSSAVAASGVAVPSSSSTTASTSVPIPSILSPTSSAFSNLEQIRNEDIAEKYQKIWKDKTNIKNTVSITPIPATSPSMESHSSSSIRPSVGAMEKRPGIEIIPLTTLPSQTPMSTTITITPIKPGIAPSLSSSVLKSADKKGSSSGKRSTDDREASKSEKKRKKKREDSPMGPPEKLFPRQNSPASDSSSLTRKYPPQSTSIVIHTSPNTKPSPKHSPVYTSPKHASSSPKSPFGTLSPKHGSSGKPSMSTLKNATSPKSEKSSLALPTRPMSSSPGASSSSKNREKDGKERYLGVSNSNSKAPSSPKVKSATIKLKPLDVANHIGFSGLSNATDDVDKVRKGSLNAVIDKLKSSQSSADDSLSKPMNSTAADHLSSDLPCLNSTGTSGGGNMGTPGSEYMVKPSQDGIKITINKTKSKDGGSSSNRSKAVNTKAENIFGNSSSPKKHTGLKPGVNSGPASKKTSSTLPFSAQPPIPTSKSSSSSATNSSQSGTKHNFQKSNSSGNLSTKSSTGSGSSLTKSQSTNSFHSDSFRKSTSTGSKSRSTSNFIEKIPPRPDPMMKILQFASPNMAAMEGFMKTFNTKFQIPKLSARSSNSQVHEPSGDSANKPRPISAPSTPATTFTPSPTPSSSESSGNSNDSNKILAKIAVSAANKGQPQDIFNLTCHTAITAPSLLSTPASLIPNAHFNSHRGQLIDSNSHASDLSMRPPSTPSITDDLPSLSASTLKNDIKLLPPVQAQTSSVQILSKLPFHQHPPSPSVSVHILKSPVPSPLVVMPSPHSNSPCITDDELVDDTLVGVGSK